MNRKSSIIGVFVKKSDILCFIERLKNEFNVQMNRIFVHNVERNKTEYLVTIKSYDSDVDLKKLPKSSVLHVKNGCLFSINALNTLIDSKLKRDEDGKKNIEYEIDWNEYKDTLMVTVSNCLSISKITKIDDLSALFNE